MYKDKIAYHSAKVAEYTQKQAEYEASISAPSAEVEAYKNALDATFDGVKNIADSKNPFKLVLPMFVHPNMFYSRKEVADNSKSVKKLYVCVRSGIVTEETFDEFLEAFDE